MIAKLLIANRGEIALRIIRACRELEIESIAVYSEADRHAPHAAAADRAMPIGAAPAIDSYLSIANVLEAARVAGADAVHPGYGFLAENAAFASACEAAGLIFVGPPAAVIARMGSKIDARRLMEDAGVPVVPGETPDDQSDEGLERAAATVGLPLLIKASAGGGGKGMRRVRERSELRSAIQAARREAAAAFGDGTLYVERLIERPHHVEVQVIADHHGGCVHLFERECSVQRRHQKVVEESPSPSVTSEVRAEITAAAVRAATACGYRNAGTIEFLVDVDGGRGPAFYFLEMNTRLQVEHAVTEAVTGIDLVRAQLQVAAGVPLPWRQEQLSQRGHAIEVRVYAEDPGNGFIPQAGRLLLYREPPGVRVDSGVVEGGVVSVHYDPMLAKVIAGGETRTHAIERLAAALRAFPILGVRTNLPFALRILGHPQFRDGSIHTSFLDEEGATLAAGMDEEPPAFVKVAAEAAAGAPETAAVPPAGGPAGWDPWGQPSGWRA